MLNQRPFDRSNHGTCAILVLLTGIVLTGCRAESIDDTAGPADANNMPKPLPQEVVDAWKQAGAEVGLHGIADDGEIVFWTEGEPTADMLPGFHINGWKEGVVSDLPDPGAPFALSIKFSDVTDAGTEGTRRKEQYASASPGLHQSDR